MSFLDDLSQGSKYHEARVLPDGSLAITVADIDEDECLRGFQGAAVAKARVVLFIAFPPFLNVECPSDQRGIAVHIVSAHQRESWVPRFLMHDRGRRFR